MAVSPFAEEGNSCSIPPVWGIGGAKARTPEYGGNMLKWALIFFLISIVAGLFGFTGLARGSATIA